jgi:hypothetical protein
MLTFPIGGFGVKVTWQLEVPTGLPPWLRTQEVALMLPLPMTWPEKSTVPMGELTFSIGLSVSFTVAVQVVGSPTSTIGGEQLT